MNARQTLVLNRVLDGMEGKLTNAKWAAMGKCSPDTALRDINDLLDHLGLVSSPNEDMRDDHLLLPLRVLPVQE
jgi:Fic family protein